MTRSMKYTVAKTARIGLFGMVLGITPMLQGCFPIIAAGVGTGVIVVADRRSAGAQTDDQTIQFKIGNAVSDKYGSRTHINVTSYNRSVLLTGEAPNAETKDDIEKIAAGVASNVRGVVNEVQISGASSLASRSNDTYLTGKVKARMFDEPRVQINHVKVVTENSVVYLLGIVTPNEAEIATQVASTTGGVQKVVKVFEYCQPTDAICQKQSVAQPQPDKAGTN